MNAELADSKMDRDELIAWLDEWLRAYPHDIFPPSDLRQICEGAERTFTKAEAVSLAERNAAAMARHVLERVRRKLDETPVSWPATLIHDDDGRVQVRFPDFPEAMTDGHDEEEAMAEAADCLAEAVASRIADGEELPTPSPLRPGMHAIRIARAR